MGSIDQRHKGRLRLLEQEELEAVLGGGMGEDATSSCCCPNNGPCCEGQLTIDNDVLNLHACYTTVNNTLKCLYYKEFTPEPYVVESYCPW